MKKNFIALIALLSITLAGWAQSSNVALRDIPSDGEYVGLEKLPNLTPENEDVAWFRENTLLIRNGDVILDKAPITISKGVKTYSASDGGFLTYRGRFIIKDGKCFINLRLFQSGYIAFPVDKHDQYIEIKTLPVMSVSDQIGIDNVIYRHTTLDKNKIDQRLKWLYKEPMIKNN